MRFVKSVFLVALAVSGFAASQAAANLLENASFEEPVLADGPPFLGIWEAFNGGFGSSSGNSAVMPRTGAQHLDLSIVNSNNNFAGTFQDALVNSGQNVIFSGWFKTPSNPLDVGVEARIEWRDSVANVERARTPNLILFPTADYTQFMLPAVAPPLTDTARVVFAIQSFGPEPTNTGTVYIDDFSLVIPEPTTLALLTLGGLALAALRRR